MKQLWHSRTFRKFRRNKPAVIGLAIYLVTMFAAIFAPFLAPYNITDQSLEHRLEKPTLKHPLGRDSLGRDVLSRVIFGARISMKVGVIVIGVSTLIGVAIGCVAGYLGGWTDDLIMRFIDILLAFPGTLLAIAMVAFLGPGIDNVIIALCVMGWVGYARLSRGQVLQVKEFEYVKAAKALGASSPRIVFYHIVPAIMAPVMVQATIGMAGAIIGEGGLSFLGLGVKPPTPSWGSMLLEGVEYMNSAPHLTIFPGLAIMLVVLGLNFLGDGLRDALDPKVD